MDQLTNVILFGVAFHVMYSIQLRNESVEDPVLYLTEFDLKSIQLFRQYQLYEKEFNIFLINF